MPSSNNGAADESPSPHCSVTPASTNGQSERFRNTLTSSSRSAIGAAVRTTGRRATNHIQSRRGPSSIRRGRHRMAIHKVLTGFFSSNSAVPNPHPGHVRGDSSASDRTSISRVNTHASLQSLELMSPGTFLFSGPSLRSACSSSIGYSTSLVESQSSLGTIGNDSHLSFEDFQMRRVNSEQALGELGDFVEDGILEPFLYCDITHSMSDVLGIGSPIQELDDAVLEDGQNDNGDLAGHSGVRPQATNAAAVSSMLPAPVLAKVSAYLDALSVKAMRLTCHAWCSAITAASPKSLAPACKLPNELVQHIYSFLAPREFNAARHTCRTWMNASLHRTILKSMLRRGGWLGGAENNLRKRRPGQHDEITGQEQDEWFLSKRISRECALSCEWTGNGLETSAAKNGKYHVPLVEVARTDFADLASGSAGPEGRHPRSLVFTASVCGKFLLVAEGGMIYVYQLEGASLRPLTSIVCPRRVLAMSIDASSHRFAVAALLEGRMGLVCDLNLGTTSEVGGPRVPTGVGVNSEHHAHRHRSKATVFTSGTVGDDSRSYEGVYSDSLPQDSSVIGSIDVQAGNDQINLQDADNHQSHEQNHINRNWELLLRGGGSNLAHTRNAQAIPIDNGPRSIYRHLCSDDDPPRCVSMCPQRRCVAFGCSAGIELYWVDALTGQNLNRWFPLTSPSDFLHFLPPRPGVDSAKKLRLISSAAHPSDRPSISRRFLSNRPNPSLFWGSFGFENRSNIHGRGTGNSDHFRAVPLNDGYNVLFTDPATSRLYLGSDAPQGGPTKLLRTLMLMPPEADDIPRIYTAAADLTWGVRVVAAFADKVVLYSISPDVFAQECSEITDASRARASDGKESDHWAHWLGKDEKLRLYHSPPYPQQTTATWPIGIKGTVIGTLDGLVDLAVYVEPELTVWAFGADGRAVTWQVDNGRRPLFIKERNVGRDGLVAEQHDVDVDGDVIMPDAEGDGERSVGFDGHDSALLQRLPGALHINNDEFVNSIDVSSGEAWYDQDGDIVMFDADADTEAGGAGWAADDWMVHRYAKNSNH